MGERNHDGILMPCVDIPIPAIPSLPSGLTLSTPTPSFAASGTLLCCISYSLAVVAPGVSLNIPMPAAIPAALSAARKAMIAWKASLPLQCPRQ